MRPKNGVRYRRAVGKPVPRHRPCPRTPTIAGDRPPRYGRRKALRENRDREVSPTGETESLGVSQNPFDNNEL